MPAARTNVDTPPHVMPRAAAAVRGGPPGRRPRHDEFEPAPTARSTRCSLPRASATAPNSGVLGRPGLGRTATNPPRGRRPLARRRRGRGAPAGLGRFLTRLGAFARVLLSAGLLASLCSCGSCFYVRCCAAPSSWRSCLRCSWCRRKLRRCRRPVSRGRSARHRGPPAANEAAERYEDAQTTYYRLAGRHRPYQAAGAGRQQNADALKCGRHARALEAYKGGNADLERS